MAAKRQTARLSVVAPSVSICIALSCCSCEPPFCIGSFSFRMARARASPLLSVSRTVNESCRLTMSRTRKSRFLMSSQMPPLWQPAAVKLSKVAAPSAQEARNHFCRPELPRRIVHPSPAWSSLRHGDNTRRASSSRAIAISHGRIVSWHIAKHLDFGPYSQEFGYRNTIWQIGQRREIRCELPCAHEGRRFVGESRHGVGHVERVQGGPQLRPQPADGQ